MVQLTQSSRIVVAGARCSSFTSDGEPTLDRVTIQPKKLRVPEDAMARRLKDIKEIKIERPARAKLSAEESLKRTKEFDKRKERFIASIRKGKG